MEQEQVAMEVGEGIPHPGKGPDNDEKNKGKTLG